MTLDLNKSEAELQQDLDEAAVADRRERKLHRLVIGLILVAVAVAMVGAFFVYRNQAATEQVSRERMDDNGAQAIAHLNNEFRVITWKNGKRTYEMTYSFEVNGHPYYGSCELANRPESDQAIAIYDPENPKMNKLKGRAIPPMTDVDRAWKDTPIGQGIYWGILALLLGIGQKLIRRRT